MHDYLISVVRMLRNRTLCIILLPKQVQMGRFGSCFPHHDSGSKTDIRWIFVIKQHLACMLQFFGLPTLLELGAEPDAQPGINVRYFCIFLISSVCDVIIDCEMLSS